MSEGGVGKNLFTGIFLVNNLYLVPFSRHKLSLKIFNQKIQLNISFCGKCMSEGGGELRIYLLVFFLVNNSIENLFSSCSVLKT